MDSALLSILALLLCHGRLLSLVLGLDPPGSCGRLAVCAVPWAILAERRELWREVVVVEVEPVVLLLQRRSRLSAGRRRSSMSGVGVVLRDEPRELLRSRPR
jgi:hypothetical protein